MSTLNVNSSYRDGTPRYERTPSGGLDYVVVVDVDDFEPRDMAVSQSGRTVLLEAEKNRLQTDGSSVKHEFRREIQLPPEVVAPGLVVTYLGDGRMELRAPFESSSARRSRFPRSNDDDSNYTRDRVITVSRSPFSRTGWRSRSYGHIARRPPVRIEYDLDPLDRPLRSSSHEYRPYRYNYLPYTGYARPAEYVHDIQLDREFRWQDLSIAVDNQVVCVRAEQNRDCNLPSSYRTPYWRRSPDWCRKEFSCEHTLPRDVDSSQLRAELNTGTLTLRAPYRQCPPPAPFSPAYCAGIPIPIKRL